MYIKTLTSENFNGETITMDYRFNLTMAEMTKMQLTTEGGLKEKIERIIAAKDNVTLINEFTNLIDLSYGEKSLDGNRFIKSKEITDAFKQTQAYSDFYMLLVTDDKEALAFVNGIIPKELRDEMKNVPQNLIENVKR